MAWAAALVAARGVDFVDINCGCPIDYFTRKGLGASVGRHPNRLRRLVEAIKRAAAPLPVTAKIRLGWSDTNRNYLKQAQAAVDGGADALIVHGRTRNARYRFAADWAAIGEIAAAVPVPVIGNGDLLFPHEIEEARQRSGCAAVMVARAALIKPWIFREATTRLLGHLGRRAARAVSALCGARPRALGRRRSRPRPRPHVHRVAPGFLVPIRAAARGRHVSVDAAARQRVRAAIAARSRCSHDRIAAAVEFLTECLALDRPIDPEAAPPPSATPAAADQRDVEG